ncbi:MAG: sugar phosphate isomerase/epimerase family protein [Promethearchaeota archaeon]
MEPEKNILSCRPGSYGNYSLYAYEHLAEVGVEYVEIDVPPAGQEGGIRDILDEFGLKVGSVVGQFDAKVLKNEKKLRAAAENQANGAKNLDARIVFASVNPGKMKEADWVAALRLVGDVFEKYDLVLSLETHPPLVPNGAGGKRTMELVDHPRVRVNFDTANVYYYNEGDVDSSVELDAVIDYVASVHLKETDGKYHSWCFPALGEGVVKFPEIIEKLNARGFHGPFTLEIEGVKGEDLTLELAKRRVEDSVAYLRRIGAIA